MSGLNISQIEEKFTALIRKLRLLQEENGKLSRQLEDRDLMITDQKKELEKLKEEINVLELTSHSGLDQADEAYRKSTRDTINSYIKEIDNCIALLKE